MKRLPAILLVITMVLVACHSMATREGNGDIFAYIVEIVSVTLCLITDRPASS